MDAWFPEDHWISLLSSLPFFVMLLLPASHSCFKARGFFLQSPDESAALSSPTGRSVKAIALAVRCLTYQIRKTEWVEGGHYTEKKKGRYKSSFYKVVESRTSWQQAVKIKMSSQMNNFFTYLTSFAKLLIWQLLLLSLTVFALFFIPNLCVFQTVNHTMLQAKWERGVRGLYSAGKRLRCPKGCAAWVYSFSSFLFYCMQLFFLTHTSFQAYVDREATAGLFGFPAALCIIIYILSSLCLSEWHSHSW